MYKILEKIMLVCASICLMCAAVSVLFINTSNPDHKRNLVIAIVLLAVCLIAARYYNQKQKNGHP